MKTLKHWSLHQQLEHHVELTVDGQHTLCLYVLEENLFRVLLKRQGQLALDRTWSIAPQQDVPWEGRARDDLSGFSLPAWQLTQEADTLTIATRQLRVTVHQPLWLEWSYRDDAGEWQQLANDRPTSAYLANAHGDGVAHYLSRRKDERFYGWAKRPAICSAPVSVMRCATSTPWATTPPAPTRCINIFRSPSPSAATSAMACFTTT
jgi:alpha-glucosidase